MLKNECLHLYTHWGGGAIHADIYMRELTQLEHVSQDSTKLGQLSPSALSSKQQFVYKNGSHNSSMGTRLVIRTIHRPNYTYSVELGLDTGIQKI